MQTRALLVGHSQHAADEIHVGVADPKTAFAHDLLSRRGVHEEEDIPEVNEALALLLMILRRELRA